MGLIFWIFRIYKVIRLDNPKNPKNQSHLILQKSQKILIPKCGFVKKRYLSAKKTA
jgi:hypothetical protein